MQVMCGECGQWKDGNRDFYVSGSPGMPLNDVCKDCVAATIDLEDESTVSEIMRQLDHPFISKLWRVTVNKTYSKAPPRFSVKAALGNYIRLMKLQQYVDRTFADSEDLVQEYDTRCPEPVELHLASDPLEKYRLGEITKKQYLELTAVADAEQQQPAPISVQQPVEQPTAPDPLRDKLTDEDVVYLTAKWGPDFSASEWVQMEDLYNRYAQEYDLNIDREQTLKMICKTTVKMDAALVDGNIADYQKLAGVLKDLRMSGKFTESQKVEKTRYLDTVGELVAFCEREGGIIPQYEDPDEFPKDKVDFTIRDLKAYNYNLVVNEMGLGSIIETYIQRLERAENESEVNADDLIISNEEADEDAMNDIAAADWQNYLESGIDDEIEDLLRQVSS